MTRTPKLGRLTIALATSSEYPDLPPDEHILVSALQDAGHNVQPAVWDDASIHWEQFDACVVRSTWDFHLKYQAFSEWITRVAKVTMLVNSKSLMLWNIKKSYLLELESKGVPIVPTIVLKIGDATEPADIALKKSWDQFVLKPLVSASSYRTQRFGRGSSARALLQTIHQDADALLQPYVPDVELGCERSYVAINGNFTHVIKRAPFNGGAKGMPQPRTAALPDEQKVANHVLSVMDELPTYVRIDLVRIGSNEPVVAEVEMIEPALFFDACRPSASLFAEALVRRIRS